MSKERILSECWDLTLLAVGRSQNDGDWNFGPINSSFTRIYYVYAGEASVELNGNIHKLTPGHLYLIPPFVTHIDRCDTIFCHYYAHFIDRKQEILSLYLRYNMPFEIDANPLDEMVHARMCQLCSDMYIRDSKPDTYEGETQIRDVIDKFDSLNVPIQLEIHTLLLLLLSRFLENATLRSTVTDERVKRTIRYIDRHINEPISLKMLADNVALGKDRFIRLFKQEIGETPVQYIVRQKIKRAQLLLTSTDKIIKEIAYSLGFSSESYFDRVFRQYIHLSPSDFRQQNQTLSI